MIVTSKVPAGGSVCTQIYITFFVHYNIIELLKITVPNVSIMREEKPVITTKFWDIMAKDLMQPKVIHYDYQFAVHYRF